MGKKRQSPRPETFSESFRLNYQQETEPVVIEAFSFLVGDYGFNPPAISHTPLLSYFIYCSEDIEIQMYYEWLDSFADIKVTKNGLTYRVFELFPLIWPAREDRPQYWTANRPTSKAELFAGILLVRDALAKCMPYIRSTDFAYIKGNIEAHSIIFPLETN